MKKKKGGGSFSKSEPTLFTFLKFHTRKGNGMRHDLIAKLSHLHLPLVALSLFRTLNTLRTGDADLRFYITTVRDG